MSRTHIPLLFFVVLSMQTLAFAARGASPLERTHEHDIKETPWAYTTPSLNYLGFTNRDYLAVHPGHLWYKSWLFTTMEMESIGINFLPWRWDAGSYANATAVTMAKGGYLFRLKHFAFYGALKTGAFYTREIKDHSGWVGYGDSDDTSAFLGVEVGFRVDLWRLWFQLEASTMSAANLHLLA
ncbi:hypothetical protein KJ865_11460, partial [Myxococcota bacterium]|nr:hypothetical protein [Myxococcota bacterium]